MIDSQDVVEDVDLLVVGGGKAGKTLAAALSEGRPERGP
jgi:L-2-hydroxyglutarate oxidase LhgO